MTTATTQVQDATFARTALATPCAQAEALALPGGVRRAAVVVGDLLWAVAIVLCVPVVILAIGTPIALCVRLLLWVGGWL